MKKPEKIKVLRDVREVFCAHDVPLWLESGLLLGLIRDKDFIEWDNDFDFGTSARYLEKVSALAKSFVGRGYSAYYSKSNNILGLWKDGWSIDIPFWRIENGRATMPLRYAENKFGHALFYLEWVLLMTPASAPDLDSYNKVKFAKFRSLLCRVTDWIPLRLRQSIVRISWRVARLTGNRRGLVTYPANFFEDTITASLNGVSFLIPRKSEEYLEYVYGSTWRIPMRDFDFMQDQEGIEKQTEQYDGQWRYLKDR